MKHLLLIAIAGILFFAYRKVADYYFAKGWTEAHEKFRDKEYWDSVFIGDTPLKNVSSGKSIESIGTETLRNVVPGDAVFFNDSLGNTSGGIIAKPITK